MHITKAIKGAFIVELIPNCADLILCLWPHDLTPLRDLSDPQFPGPQIDTC